MKYFLILFLTTSIFAKSQNLNGIWKGRLNTEPGACFLVHNIEMQLNINDTIVSGYCYHYSDTINFVRVNLIGRYNKDSQIIYINETGIVSFHLPPDCEPCFKKYKISLHKNNQVEELRGSFTAFAKDNFTRCPPGSLTLVRDKVSDFKPIVQLPEKLIQRENKLVKEIFVDTGKIKLDFYDNGIIDGDIISVYVNGINLVNNKTLDIKPITTFINISLKNKIQEVVMVGESMGSIPPNTALMIVTVGEDRYQLFLTSDEQKNAMIRFIYKPKKK